MCARTRIFEALCPKRTSEALAVDERVHDGATRDEHLQHTDMDMDMEQNRAQMAHQDWRAHRAVVY